MAIHLVVVLDDVILPLLISETVTDLFALVLNSILIFMLRRHVVHLHLRILFVRDPKVI